MNKFITENSVIDISIMILTTRSQSLSPIHSYGYAYITSNQHQIAIDYFQSLITKNPNDFLSYQGISIALAKQDKIEDAITYLTKAIDIEPNCSSFYFFQSIFYQKINQNSNALLSLKKGLEIDPENKIGLELLEKISRINEVRTDKADINPLLWSNESNPILIKNINLKDMMVYWSHGKPQFPEPSCICINLPIDNFHTNIEPLPPFPDYSDINPSQRAYYLNWLHGGRCNVLSDNSYLFLYLFGLERRALLDENDEIKILQECIRLKRTYPSMTSFFSYISSFIGYLLYKNIKNISNSDIKEWYNSTDLIGPNELRVLLLWYVEHNKPIPANIAFHIVDYYSNGVEKLGKKELKIKKDLFSALFSKVYPRGFSVKPSRQTFKLVYIPSNPILKVNTTQKDQYQMNLTKSLLSRKGQYISLFNLWQEILKIEKLEEIDKILKNSDVLCNDVQKKKKIKPKTAEEVWEVLLSQINIEEKNGSAILKLETLKELMSFLKRESQKPHKLIELQSFIKKHGYEVVPNLDGKYNPAINCIGIIYKHPSSFHSNIYEIATFFLEIGMYIIHADKKIENKEIECLSNFLVSNFPLNPFDSECINLYKEILIYNSPDSKKIEDILKNIKREDQKITIASFIIDIILADNHIDGSEVDSLIQILSWMDFSRTVADSIIQDRLVELNMKIESKLLTQNVSQEDIIFSEETQKKISIEDLKDNRLLIQTNEALKIMSSIMLNPSNKD